MSVLFQKGLVASWNFICFCLNIPDAHQIFLKRIYISCHGNTVADADGHLQDIVQQCIVSAVGNRGIQGTFILLPGDHIVCIVGWVLDHIESCLRIFTARLQIFPGKIVPGLVGNCGVMLLLPFCQIKHRRNRKQKYKPSKIYPPAAEWYRDFFFLQKNAKGSTDKKQYKISCDQVPDLLIM